MKKSGIRNGKLAAELATMGGGDLFLICNAKMALPREICVIDLALCAGIPTVEQVLRAIVEEVKVEYAFLAEELKEKQEKTYACYHELLAGVKEEQAASISFKSYIRNVKFAVRTADMTPYANLILRAGEVDE